MAIHQYGGLRDSNTCFTASELSRTVYTQQFCRDELAKLELGRNINVIKVRLIYYDPNDEGQYKAALKTNPTARNQKMERYHAVRNMRRYYANGKINTNPVNGVTI